MEKSTPTWTRKDEAELCSERRFFEFLALLAGVCGEQKLSKSVIALYDRGFALEVGYEVASATIERILIDRSAKDPMPSVGDLRRKCQLSTSFTEQDEAELSATVIMRCIGKHGYTWIELSGDRWPQVAIDELGRLAWNVVQAMGGWRAVCENIDPPGVFRSSLVKTALAIRRGVDRVMIEKAPVLPGIRLKELPR